MTSSFDNDYDKLKAIEEMLSTYHYTTNPVELDREHFMDDFLLDKKEGYCSENVKISTSWPCCIYSRANRSLNAAKPPRKGYVVPTIMIFIDFYL